MEKKAWSIQPINILLCNFYVIFLLQLALNWNAMDCGALQPLWQLCLFIILIARVLLDELGLNQVISYKNRYIGLIASSSILLCMALFMIVNVSQNGQSFSSEPCFSNRIVYIGESIIMIMALPKDIIFLCCSKEDKSK